MKRSRSETKSFRINESSERLDTINKVELLVKITKL